MSPNGLRWFEFVSKTDQQRVDAYLRRSKKCGFCPQSFCHSKNKVTPWHSNCLTKFNAIIICLSAFFHHLRHHHRTTISRQDHTASSYFNELSTCSRPNNAALNVRRSTKSFSDLKEIWYLGTCRWVTRSKVKVTEVQNVKIAPN